MNFGEAIEALKKGHYVQREGWNGKGMYIYAKIMQRTVMRNHTERTYDPVICMYTAQHTHQPGWLASQADILAEDWSVVYADVDPDDRTHLPFDI